MRPLLTTSCRDVRLFCGPTNSGKTFAALEELCKAKGGVCNDSLMFFFNLADRLTDAAPLRLLALEGFKALTKMGVATSLLTGQQRVDVEGAKFASVTVEMIESSRVHNRDVMVLDEIQMIGDSSRGWAWTRALLNSSCNSVILCGQPGVAQLVRRLVPSAVLVEKEFSRFSTLAVEPDCLQSVRKQDCLVSFSRKELYKLKRELESKGLSTCVVYSSLPPEMRQLQAEMFNKGDSVLLGQVSFAIFWLNLMLILFEATDAVGLGLNLNIRRIVFTTVRKFDGEAERLLFPSEVKQIAGRAGRGTELGFVTAMTEEDRKYVNWCLQQDPEQVGERLFDGGKTLKLSLERAGFLPSLEDLLVLNGGDVEDASALSVLFDQFLTEHHSLPELRDFFLCKLDDMINCALIADAEGFVLGRKKWENNVLSERSEAETGHALHLFNCSNQLG
jgi:ATP-dependent RNA helicase SUPV3L1/SUV3